MHLKNKVIGCILYLFDPSFRKILTSKKSGPNDRVRNGETVFAVLNSLSGKKKIIKGAK